MASSSSFLLAVLLVTIGMTSLQVLPVSGYEFDHDASPELCQRDIMADPGVCTKNSTMWFSCPISCAKMMFGGRGTMAEERSDPEEFFELHAKRATNKNDNGDNNNAMSLEENEGYITLYAVLPMLPGMAQYYYDAIEHIAHVYKYTLVAMILPSYNTDDQDESMSESSTSSSIILQSIFESRKDDNNKNKKTTKSILLEGYDTQQKSDNAVLEYLLTREVVAGSLDLDSDNNDNYNDNVLLMTRPNIFIVSHNGMFIERIVSPTMEMIERRIKVHEIAMENGFEL